MKIIRKIIEKTNRFFSMAPTLDYGKAKGEIWVLVAKGIEDNKDWCGAWMNDYLFSRLEFVCCNYKEKL